MGGLRSSCVNGRAVRDHGRENGLLAVQTAARAAVLRARALDRSVAVGLRQDFVSANVRCDCGPQDNKGATERRT